MRPNNSEFAPFYKTYIDKAEGETVAELIAKYPSGIASFIEAIPEAKGNFAYAENKWTVKQLIQHLTDCERIFSYRALRIARKDKTPLSGFEEDDYAANDETENRSLQSVKDEFLAVRKSTDLLLNSFSETQLQQKGISNNYYISVNGLVFIIYGHLLHHINILKERYL